MASVDTTEWLTGNGSVHVDLVRPNYNLMTGAEFSKVIRFLQE